VEETIREQAGRQVSELAEQRGAWDVLADEEACPARMGSACGHLIGNPARGGISGWN
jgi:hypothetical protein